MRKPEAELKSIQEAGLLRSTRGLLPGGDMMVRDDSGREMVNFSSNDYLGLASHPELANAMSEAAECYGSGSGASRLICGTHPAHMELEERLAEFKSAEAALSFNSGFSAAMGTLTSLLQKGDTVILDKLCHASLVDGARLSGATIRVFPHNNLEKLERLLRSSTANASEEARVLLVTESVFSMDGDRSPLKDIVELKDKFGALLMLDEAHAFGVIGRGGRGLADELGVSDRVDIFLGTLSKAAGSSGGFIAADRPIIDLLKNRARSFIYTTAPPPAVAATASKAIEILGSEDGDKRRKQLWDNLAQFAQATGESQPQSAIVPFIIGDESDALHASDRLQEDGFLIPAIRYPTVSKGLARLRITLSANHSPKQIGSLASSLSKLKMKS